MKRLLMIVPLALTLSTPALAAPGEEPRQDAPQQTRKSDYWLSRDMQKLVFWQSREGETRVSGETSR